MGTILVTRAPPKNPTPIGILIGGITGPNLSIKFASTANTDSVVGTITLDAVVSYSGVIVLGGTDADKFAL